MILGAVLLCWLVSFGVGEKSSDLAPQLAANWSKTSFSTDAGPLRGVSLGGWLVLEPWITPSLFEPVDSEIPVDEYTLSEKLGPRAKPVLEQHWDTFYSSRDLKDVAEYGLNLVRIPIGYWAFGLLDGDPYVQGQEFYLDRALEWARQYGLRVQVDVHGMPGSQNGFDNSGRRVDEPMWMKSAASKKLSYKVAAYVLEKYGSHPSVHSIQVVNEPMAHEVGFKKLKRFYRDVHSMAQEKNIKAQLYFDDGFLPIDAWDDFLVDPNVIFSHHIYEVFEEDPLGYSVDQHLQKIKGKMLTLENSSHPTIIGEFSAALTDCTKYLNGVGVGSRYSGTHPSSTTVFGSCVGHTNFSSWPLQSRLDTRRFLREQLKLYEKYGRGWIFWCYKTEDSIEWDFRRASSYGLMPKLETAPLVTAQVLVNVTRQESVGMKNGISVFAAIMTSIWAWISLV